MAFKFPARALPRGLRNNNPGNLVKNQVRWQGEVWPGSDSHFATFVSMEYGVRAMHKLLSNYLDENIVSLHAIIARYAPAFENNVAAYVNNVARVMLTLDGIPRTGDTRITKVDLPVMIYAMIVNENGQSIPMGTVVAGCQLS